MASCTLTFSTMARKSRVRLLAVLLVFIPLFTLLVLLGVEWNFVEVLQSQGRHEKEAPEHAKKIRVLRQRTPLANNNVGEDVEDAHSQQEVNTGGTASVRVSRASTKEPDTEYGLSNGGLARPGLKPDIQLLKERKREEGRVENGVKEMWWYLRAKLHSLKSQLSQHGKAVDDILHDVEEQFQLLNSHLKEMEDVSDGSDPLQPNWKYWQSRLLNRTEGLLQRRLQYLQNPPDCQTARKLLCDVAKGCGFGCQMHHVAYCFIMAYATQRTLVLDSHSWKYSRETGWDGVFMPVSKTCTSKAGSNSVAWTKRNQEAQVIHLPTVDNMGYRPPQLPMAVPRDLADTLLSFHGYPFVWFIGQILKYLMRPNEELESYIDERRKALGFKYPVVGVHVRRTDKRQEARYHMIEEYMEEVEEWYRANTEEGVQRRVFLATDDPQVLQEARQKYPSYEFISDGNISTLASKVQTRYSVQSLYGVIFDVQMLSECDYIVCTFSSQVCRLAYELMQTHHVDASRNFYSLDDIYYFGGQQAHDVRALQGHRSSSSFSFEKGDLLGIAGNEKNGQSVGIHRRMSIRGAFPSYKVEEKVIVADFPTYPDVE